MASTVGLKMIPLTLSDRCDRCSATAYVKVAMLNGDLLFCGHCWHLLKGSLIKAAIGILDECDRR